MIRPNDAFETSLSLFKAEVVSFVDVVGRQLKFTGSQRDFAVEKFTQSMRMVIAVAEPEDSLVPRVAEFIASTASKLHQVVASAHSHPIRSDSTTFEAKLRDAELCLTSGLQNVGLVKDKIYFTELDLLFSRALDNFMMH
eukprot:c17951_g1_i4.p1 GENE.c17951_g1_i4~~c17951_g1_i4.p1  ORF type:complete len:140 (+),score=21.18 c17951_g1_i4:216-635(+)